MPGGIHPPWSVIATWPEGNYEHPVTRGLSLVVVTITLYAVAVVAVVARLWARLMMQRNAGLDDLLIVFSLVVALGMTISVCLASQKYGFNRHVWNIYIPELVSTRQVSLASEFFYILSTTLTRLSILFFYRRMAKGTFSNKFVWSVRITIACVISYGIIFEATLLFGCSPIDAYWRQVDFPWLATHTYTCIDEAAATLSASVASMLQDLLTCLLPTLLFWKLRLPRRQKFALGAIFGVGGFLCVTAIVRIYYIHYLFYETYDTTWYAYESWLWTSVETHMGIVCASAPALKIFFTHALNGTSLGSGSYGSNRFRSSSAIPFNKRSVEGDRDVESAAEVFRSAPAIRIEETESPIEMSTRYNDNRRFEQRRADAKAQDIIRVKEALAR